MKRNNARTHVFGIGVCMSALLIAGCLAFLLFYGLIGSKNVNKDIPVDENQQVPDAI